MCKGSRSPHHGLNLLIFCLYNIQPNSHEVLIYFALMISEVGSLLLCKLATCMSCSRNICLNLCTFLNSFIYSLKIFICFTFELWLLFEYDLLIWYMVCNFSVHYIFVLLTFEETTHSLFCCLRTLVNFIWTGFHEFTWRLFILVVRVMYLFLRQ